VISEGDGDHARAFYRVRPLLPTGNACVRDSGYGTSGADFGISLAKPGTKFGESGTEEHGIRDTEYGASAPGGGDGMGVRLSTSSAAIHSELQVAALLAPVSRIPYPVSRATYSLNTITWLDPLKRISEITRAPSVPWS
jgi:hypothetical protein